MTAKQSTNNKAKSKPPPLDIYRLTIGEAKLIQETTGKKYQEVIDEFGKGIPDIDILQAFGLIWLRRRNPNATMEDAENVEIIPMLAGDEEDVDLETAMKQAAAKEAEKQETANPS